jgi:hypothetical protein
VSRAAHRETTLLSAELEEVSDETSSWKPVVEEWRSDIAILASSSVREAVNTPLQSFTDPDNTTYQAARASFKEAVRKEFGRQ